MYKIGIIGAREDTMFFMALGFSVKDAKTPAEAATCLHELAKSGEYAVIFLTEDLAKDIPEDIARYKDAPMPAITLIPGKNGGNGIGAETIRNAVVRAVGTDFLLN